MFRFASSIPRAATRWTAVGLTSSSRIASNGSKLWLSTSSASFSSVPSGDNYDSDDKPSKPMYDKVAFIGTGKMAQAMMYPLIKNGFQPEDQVGVYDVSTTAMKQVKKEFPKIQLAQSIADLVHDADLVVCAVKPQNITKAFWAQFPEKIREGATFVSILAGKPIKDFKPSGYAKLVRSMPNTPATIGQGMTVWSCTPNLQSDERAQIKKVLSTFGKAIYVDDEKFIDMSTSISGSGPAYIFLLMEAMIDAGVHMGFSRDTAQTLCYHTLLGSTLYAMETGEHPAILRNMVTSPAGTTASAIYELENGKFRVVIKDAIWACYRRSLEMGGKHSDVGPGRMISHNSNEARTQIIHHHHHDGPQGEMKHADSDNDEEPSSMAK